MSTFRIAAVALSVSLFLGAAWAAPTGTSSKVPARVTVEVEPDAVRPGEDGEVVVRIVPEDGIRINRYPKIKLSVPAHDGLVAAAEAAVGNDSPPDPDRMKENYFDRVDPVRLRLRVDPAAAAGAHELDAKLVYYYCVSASGYCAPKRVALRIPLTVR